MFCFVLSQRIHLGFIGCQEGWYWCISIHNVLRAGVCRPCVETKLMATKKLATDGN